MNDFLLATWHGAGTTPPLMSVTRALVQRGHQVRVLADAALQPEVEAAGATYLAWSRAPQRRTFGRESDFVRDWETSDPAESFARTRDRISVGAAGLYAADVRNEIERHRPDAVLSELLLWGPLIAAEATGVPAIVLNPTINIVPVPGVPPFGFGLLPATDAAEQARDVELAQVAVQAWDGALPALNTARAEQGLPPLEHVLDQGRSAARVLVLTSSAFDFSGPLPPTVRHVGPRLDDPAWVSDAWEPPPGDGPLVLVAFSSEYQGHEELLRRLVAALGGMPVRAVVTTGQGVDPDAIGHAANVQVVRSAPHRDVMAQAQLVVTHAGHGTVIKALAAGVPLVCLPLGRDQLDVTARVVHAGAGLRVDAAADVETLRGGVCRVLDDPSYSQAARRLAEAIAADTSGDRAVEEIEDVVAETRVAVASP